MKERSSSKEERVGRVSEFTSDSRVKVVHAQIRDTYAAQSTTVGGQTSRIRGASDSLVNSGQASTITHESDISRIQSRQAQISTKGSTANLLYPTCTLCGKPAGQGICISDLCVDYLHA